MSENGETPAAPYGMVRAWIWISMLVTERWRPGMSVLTDACSSLCAPRVSTAGRFVLHPIRGARMSHSIRPRAPHRKPVIALACVAGRKVRRILPSGGAHRTRCRARWHSLVKARWMARRSMRWPSGWGLVSAKCGGCSSSILARRRLPWHRRGGCFLQSSLLSRRRCRLPRWHLCPASAAFVGSTRRSMHCTIGRHVNCAALVLRTSIGQRRLALRWICRTRRRMTGVPSSISLPHVRFRASSALTYHALSTDGRTGWRARRGQRRSQRSKQ